MAFEIIEFIKENPGFVIDTINSISNIIICGLFLKRKEGIKAATKELEKEKVRVLNVVAEEMLENGDISYYEYSKIKNYKEIAKKADQYRKKKTVAAQNMDWHIRFFEECGTVSDENLRDLWAKLLANEVDTPGNCSFRTLNTLKNLTPREAFLFQRVCRGALRIEESVAILKIGDCLEKKGITYDDILKLDDCGLIRNDELVRQAPFKDGRCFTKVSNDKILLFKTQNKDPKAVMRIPQYLFTSAGRELYSVIGKEIDIQEVVDLLKTQFPEYEIEHGELQNSEPNKEVYKVGNETIQYVKIK